MPSPSKSKGSAFERDLAKHLTKVFKENFMRVPASGAFVGQSNAYRMDDMSDLQKRVFRGDIIPGPSLQNVKFECKSYKSFAWPKMLSGDNKQLNDWLEQSYDPLVLWFLVFKINNAGNWVAFGEKFMDSLKVSNTAVLNYKAPDPVGNVFVFKMDGFFDENAAAITEISKDIQNEAESKSNSNT
tara:strand:+ start:560 stop:1114 length:555 start_codon:yes stop_codon:yes gene_type:complete